MQLQYLVCDGGSTDNTLETFDEYAVIKRMLSHNRMLACTTPLRGGLSGLRAK